MAVKRKCLKCQTWNSDVDHCVNCDEVLSPELLEKEREEIREIRRNSKPASKLDQFLLKWRTSPNVILKSIYYILYSIGFIFFSIAAFFAWLAAAPNG